MKSKSSLVALLVLAVVAGWTTAETYRLWQATEQVAASQKLEMRVAAKVAAVRARQLQLATVDASARGSGSAQK